MHAAKTTELQAIYSGRFCYQKNFAYCVSAINDVTSLQGVNDVIRSVTVIPIRDQLFLLSWYFSGIQFKTAHNRNNTVHNEWKIKFSREVSPFR